MKRLLAAGIALLVITAACSAFAAPKGNLKITGSTTVLPLSQMWAEEFMAKYPGTSISVSGGGSGTGISNLLNGICNIANSSREAKPKEIDTARSRNVQLTATKIARDGLSIIVNDANDIKTLSIDQLRAIYSGSAGSWKAVGGSSSKEIVVIGRDSSSGTYGFFQEAVLGGGAYVKGMLSMPTTQAICQAVAQSKDAIGYVGMAYAEEFAKAGKVRIVAISRKRGGNAMIPSKANVTNGTYPLFRYLYMYTIGAPKGITGDFVKYALSPEGQKLVTESGYLPL